MTTTITTREQLAALRPDTVLLCSVHVVFQLKELTNGGRVWFAAGYEPVGWPIAEILKYAPLQVLWEPPLPAVAVAAATVTVDAQIARWRIALAMSVAMERDRQWSLGFDAAHDAGRSLELRLAADCYLNLAREQLRNPAAATAALLAGPGGGWPWSEDAWSPSLHAGRNLVKAFALEHAADDAQAVLE